MRYKTTRDIIDEVRNMYATLLDYHEKLRDEAVKGRMKTLLDYLLRQEERIDDALAEWEEGARKQVLDRWFQRTPEIAGCDFQHGFEVEDRQSPREVIAKTLAYEECLRKLFGWIADEAVEPEVKQVFKSLADMEERSEKALAKLDLEFQDE